MPVHVTHPQGTVNSNTVTSESAGASSSVDSSVNSRVTACEKLVDEAVEKDLPASVFAESLKSMGLKAVEAADYLDEFNQRVAIRRSKAKQPGSPTRELSTETHPAVEDQFDRDRAVEEAAWASLMSKLQAEVPAPLPSPSGLVDKMLDFLGQDVASSTSLSKAVLAVAPHLADDKDTIFEDPYLKETHKCKIAYTSQRPFENLVIRGQGRRMREPVANSIWRLVILDKYVDFEKLYATLDPGYNPHDDAKDLNDKFMLLEKNAVRSKRSVLTEAEWMRLYDIWVEAVLHFYPHRSVELSAYRELIVNMFRATVSPLPGIQYDRDSRERYSRQPYRLDSSKDVLPFPLLSQLLSHATPSSFSYGSKKRPGSSLEGSQKRSETICHNWNMGTCDGDICRFGRRHNECSECGEPHRAKDSSECLAAFHQ